MLFDLDILEDRAITRMQQAVTDGLLAFAGAIGDEDEASKTPKLPALSLLFRRATFSDPQTIDITRQLGLVEWSVFASGTNLRERGKRSGRKGATGAYHAVMVAIQYLEGFGMTTDSNSGVYFPMTIRSVELAALDQAAQRAMYEMQVVHEWPVAEFGFD